MRKLKLLIASSLVVGFISGCVVRTHSPRCHDECFWRNGRRICEQRCN